MRPGITDTDDEILNATQNALNLCGLKLTRLHRVKNGEGIVTGRINVSFEYIYDDDGHPRVFPRKMHSLLNIKLPSGSYAKLSPVEDFCKKFNIAKCCLRIKDECVCKTTAGPSGTGTRVGLKREREWDSFDTAIELTRRFTPIAVQLAPPQGSAAGPSTPPAHPQ